MTFEARIARLFAMDEATWARHANPWSVWTRFTALPLLLTGRDPGVEVPNPESEVVYLRRILESATFQKARGVLPR